ncbi:PREDICTED: uncharacterized protein LOC109486861 [Branchiostoma belcheri]|uniref:Uncharacterized protein LOC109486861 n=1 Tax=Branchiostoma belcheri TaxID=7741 RepID=A0A6P5AWI2_BRABE|nr:PREDICTED: uncharacterized protein LOC109486861 [Branchiostoma belcheri]
MLVLLVAAALGPMACAGATKVDGKPTVDEAQVIAYGGILNSFVPGVLPNDTDIQQVAQFALQYATEHAPHLVPRAGQSAEGGDFLKPEILQPRKLKLHFTQNGQNPALYELVYEQNGEKLTETHIIILGITYFLTLSWPSIANSLVHRFVVTLSSGHLYVFEHTWFQVASKTDEGTILPGASKYMQHVQADTISSTRTQDVESLTLGDSKHSVQYSSNQVCQHTSQEKQECGGQEKVESTTTTAKKSYTQSNNELSGELKIASYNVWNFNGGPGGSVKAYVQRAQHLGQVLADCAADVIALQEVRFAYNRGGPLGPNQIQHFTHYLPGYQYVFQPAMSYPESILGRVEEGVAIISKFPILSHDYILLYRNASDSEDFHQRICLHAEIETPYLGLVHLFVTHLSLSEPAQDRSVVQIWEFMQRFSGPAVLVGDLNTEPHSKAIRFLQGVEEIDRVKTEGLQDAWLMKYPEPRADRDGTYWRNEIRDSGLTFNALKNHLEKRIDYMFVRLPSDVHLHNISLLDDGKRGYAAASDHVGLMGTFTLSQDKDWGS